MSFAQNRWDQQNNRTQTRAVPHFHLNWAPCPAWAFSGEAPPAKKMSPYLKLKSLSCPPSQPSSGREPPTTSPKGTKPRESRRAELSTRLMKTLELPCPSRFKLSVWFAVGFLYFTIPTRKRTRLRLGKFQLHPGNFRQCQCPKKKFTLRPPSINSKTLRFWWFHRLPGRSKRCPPGSSAASQPHPVPQAWPRAAPGRAGCGDPLRWRHPRRGHSSWAKPCNQEGLFPLLKECFLRDPGALKGFFRIEGVSYGLLKHPTRARFKGKRMKKVR